MSQDIVINEFMASNSSQSQDPQGEYDDWIELYNGSSQPADLSGAYLTDDLNDPNQWAFAPGTIVPAGDYLLIWADGDVGDSGLHANFALSADGEEIGLFASDGTTLLDSVVYDQQQTDVSMGRFPDGDPQWYPMAEATPGQPNMQAYEGAVEEVRFSVERGFYDEPITVTLSTATPDAEIWYTTDTFEPASFVTGRVTTRQGTVYTEPIEINATTCLRAVAIKEGWRDSEVITHSYIYLNQVIRQSSNPPGFPSSWGARTVDYAMDQRIVNDPQYSDEIKDDLISTPVVCIVMSNVDLFGSEGIYSHPTAKGDQWERAASMEWIDPNTGDHFGVNAGLRIQGGAYARSRSSNPKSGLQFFFRGEYGVSKLDYPLFPDTEVQEFDRLALRAIWNYSWIGDSGGYGADYLRDCFARDTIRDMGRLTPYGRPVQVFINGLYWGLYIMTERIDDVFAADHLGGDPEDYDVLEAPSNQGGGTQMTVNTGDKMTIPPEWDILYDMAENTDMSTAEAYEAIQAYVDIPAMIDYMLMIYYTGSRDAPVFLGDQFTPRNFYALRTHEPAGPFLFIPWDVEWCLESPFENRTGIVGVYQPHVLMDALAVNPEFRILLGDYIHRAFFNDGPLTQEKVTERYMARADEIYGAIVGESARWGDVIRFNPGTREDWLDEVDRLVNDYFSIRTGEVMDQLRDRGWYPFVDAPEFYINGTYQHGGKVETGALLSLYDPAGTSDLYYTLDGSDPRDIEPQSSAGTRLLIAEDASKTVWVPTEDIGEAWKEDVDYEDASWISGAGGVGFDFGFDYNPLIGIDLLDSMWGVNPGCYIRIPFDVNDPSDLQRLFLNVRFDDGFVAYLNGDVIVRENAPETLAWDENAVFPHEASDRFDTFDISTSSDLLQAGQNLLAIHGLNASLTSLDFLISVELRGSEEAIPQGEYTVPIPLDKSVPAKAAAYNGVQWSALTQAVFSVGPIADNVRITELMYHPPAPNEEFIEVTNIGDEAVNLNLVRFTRGIDFTFGDVNLAPGQSAVVVRDRDTFIAGYGQRDRVVGQFEGRLDNGGERIVLSDPLGQPIVDFSYADNWYPVTDGGGLSLVVLSPQDTALLSQPAAWQPSPELGGSPGQW